MLMMGAVAALAALVGAAALYVAESGGAGSSQSTILPGATLSPATLTAVIGQYQALDAEHAALLVHATAIADPATAQ